MQWNKNRPATTAIAPNSILTMAAGGVVSQISGTATEIFGVDSGLGLTSTQISALSNTANSPTVDVTIMGEGKVQMGGAANAGQWITANTAGLGVAATITPGVSIPVLGMLMEDSVSADANGVWPICLIAVCPGILVNGQVLAQAPDVVLTSAQILALHGTPISIIAAAGANTAILIELVEAFFTPVTTAYTISTNAGIALKYTNASGTTLATIPTTGLIDQAAAGIRIVARGAPVSGTALTPVANAAVVANSLTADVTTGDGTVTIRCWYRIIPTV